ncbi:hypothetical protein NMG60_11020047 [Bertholletia excelsa]
MGSSREESPDWLRSFQAPNQSVLTLSSGSESPQNDSPSRVEEMNENRPSDKDISEFSEEGSSQDASVGISADRSSLKKTSKAKSPIKRTKAGSTPVKKKNTSKGNKDDGKASKLEKSEMHTEPSDSKNLVWTLSSDSESPANSDLVEASKKKSLKKGLKTEDQALAKARRVTSDINKKETDGDMEVIEEEIAEKHLEPRVSSSQLPLMLSEKVSRTKALVECEGESIDLSGDVGSVGRVVISDNPSGSQEMLLDLKGTIYKTSIVPSKTFCIVSFGQSEAKVEAIMNDFIQLKPQSNVYEAETMVEGTLEGFSFDSEDEADKGPKANGNQTDRIEGTNDDKPNVKQKPKADKTVAPARKRNKAAGGKPPKKAKKKTQAPKKTRTKK